MSTELKRMLNEAQIEITAILLKIAKKAQGSVTIHEGYISEYEYADSVRLSIRITADFDGIGDEDLE